MKALFKSNVRRNINGDHRHDARLEGQMVAIDCTDKIEVVRIDLYRKGQSYYCCLWVDIHEFDISGSGKAKTCFGAVYAALESAGISFDDELPELGRHFDQRVWKELARFVTAIAEKTGTKNCYLHDCLRSN